MTDAVTTPPPRLILPVREFLGLIAEPYERFIATVSRYRQKRYDWEKTREAYLLRVCKERDAQGKIQYDALKAEEDSQRKVKINAFLREFRRREINQMRAVHEISPWYRRYSSLAQIRSNLRYSRRAAMQYLRAFKVEPPWDPYATRKVDGYLIKAVRLLAEEGAFPSKEGLLSTLDERLFTGRYQGLCDYSHVLGDPFYFDRTRQERNPTTYVKGTPLIYSYGVPDEDRARELRSMGTTAASLDTVLNRVIDELRGFSESAKVLIAAAGEEGTTAVFELDHETWVNYQQWLGLVPARMVLDWLEEFYDTTDPESDPA